MHIWMPLVVTGTGSEVYTRSLAELLRRRGHTVTLDIVAHRYQYMPWLTPISPPESTDVILANSWNAAAFQRRSLPLVSVCHLVVHDPRLVRFKGKLQKIFHRYFVLPMEKASIKAAHVNVAVSALVARQMCMILGAKDPIVILNGVDTDFFSPLFEHAGPREEVAKGDGPLRVLFVGKPSMRKGIDVVAEIARRLGKRIDLTFVGRPPGATLLHPPGTYLGPLDREGVRDAYRNSDLLLIPSRMEGLPLVALEAMSCGVPIATFANNGASEIVTDETGIVCGQEDIDCLVASIDAYRRNPQMRMHVARSARRYILEHARQELWVDQTEAALRQAIALARKN
ncbi:glycosyltransferase family 4 protein [Croceicoccus mobilis]|uniref:Glycosyltransferase subfamily 4-like N-terminal domain-containing protein n=1 Tax=Croceicoccus mobilis TaxID=1703339 RepID=A0A916YYQ7_9SPHN|nr:glycosyltransferase family 4 protein [Croceicoccus mobilis]GGD67679.1 hypothetical protein GCM10010990_16470 [Croceicoccus mobilis]